MDKINPEDKAGVGQKHDMSKERFDLIPIKPLMALAQLFTKGSEKYGVRNWETGIKFGRLFSAMMRHTFKWWAGEICDPVDGQHHLTAVIWNAMALMELEETHPEMDDREPQNKRFPNSEIMFTTPNTDEYSISGLDKLDVDQLELIKTKIQQEIIARKK
jgi:hypothetical protein